MSSSCTRYSQLRVGRALTDDDGIKSGQGWVNLGGDGYSFMDYGLHALGGLRSQGYTPLLLECSCHIYPFEDSLHDHFEETIFENGTRLFTQLVCHSTWTTALPGIPFRGLEWTKGNRARCILLVSLHTFIHHTIT